MPKKAQFSYQKQKDKLDHILEQINETSSFDEKEKLYQQGLEILQNLESYLNTQQKVITKIIDKE